MSRPVRAVARVFEVTRRARHRVVAGARRWWDAAPPWVLRALQGLAALLVLAVAAGAAVVLSRWAQMFGAGMPMRVWGPAGLLDLALGGVLGLILTTVGVDEQGDGRLPRRRVEVPVAVRVLVAALTFAAVIGALLLASGIAQAVPAAPPPAPVPAVTDLDDVITNMRNWLMGLLAGVATLFATLGGVRYMGAGGDPAEIERAKGSFRASAVGYSLAILAPVLLTALQSVVGG